jgi:hypothetical protein
MGHVLGFQHDAAGLMAPVLAVSERYLPYNPGAAAPCCPACQLASPSPAPAARQTMVFDESQGKLLRPGLQASLTGPHDLSFNLTIGEAADSQGDDVGDAWLLALRPRKLLS